MENEVIKIAGEIFNSGSKVTFSPGLLSRTVAQIQEKLIEGYGRDFPQIIYNTPDYEELRNLTENVYSFSAAKNYQQLKDMTLALTDGERIVTEGEFVERVKAMNLKYNRDWLITERNTAVAGGQMASRWVEFERNRDITPLLEYSTVGDNKVRAAHALLDGVRKPVDDPFWSRYYPPNGWNCRCDVIAVPDKNAEPTQDEKITVPEIQPMFRTNLAKAGIIFPKGHPYFKGVPKAELRKAISYLPPKNSYHTVKGIRGDKINVHILHNAEETRRNLVVADDLIKAGYKDIHLLPDFHEKEAHLRQKFLPPGYKQRNIRKNPDAWLTDQDGKRMVCDFKVLQGERNFSQRIAEAAQQADYAIIKLDFEPKKLGMHSIEKRVTERLKEFPELKGVIVLDKKGILIFEKYNRG
mgnify:FL=1|jgi:SPP1 gp7 family putative phage head morphogenesis protein|nr:MAG TPA: minor capsid component [Caudoviricetes sp.]DAX75361.1 MAG TPA: minor capsid component [Caudoviricetes sp.]